MNWSDQLNNCLDMVWYRFCMETIRFSWRSFYWRIPGWRRVAVDIFRDPIVLQCRVDVIVTERAVSRIFMKKCTGTTRARSMWSEQAGARANNIMVDKSTIAWIPAERVHFLWLLPIAWWCSLPRSTTMEVSRSLEWQVAQESWIMIFAVKVFVG